nr:hypothetical protein [uncultured Actinoplanes sp.]
MERLPGLVRLGSFLLAAAAVLALAGAVAAVVALGHLGDAEVAYRQGVGEDSVPAQVRYGLWYNLTATLVTALVAGALAVLVRAPRRWAQIGVWCLAGAAWLGLGCGLTGGPELAAPDGGVPAATRQLLDNLMPRWYASGNTSLVLAVLGAFTVAAVVFLRPPVQEFYRSTLDQGDPQWSAFFTDRAAGGS